MKWLIGSKLCVKSKITTLISANCPFAGIFTTHPIETGRGDGKVIGRNTAVFGALQSPSCMLQKLNLCRNCLRDEEMSRLANSLLNNYVLRHLDLRSNYDVTISGWRSFSAIFQNPNSALETVDLRGNAIDDDVMVSFASSLDGNNNLKELLDEGGNRITTAGWDAFSNILCNKSQASMQHMTPTIHCRKYLSIVMENLIQWKTNLNL